MFEIIVEKYPKASSHYPQAKFAKSKKKLKLVKDEDEIVYLNGKEFICSDIYELCEALTTGNWDYPIYFHAPNARYKLQKIVGKKLLTKRNPKSLSDGEVYAILVAEINSLLEYNKTSNIFVDSLIKGLSKKHKISVKRFEEVFDKNC